MSMDWGSIYQMLSSPRGGVYLWGFEEALRERKGLLCNLWSFQHCSAPWRDESHYYCSVMKGHEKETPYVLTLLLLLKGDGKSLNCVSRDMGLSSSSTLCSWAHLSLWALVSLSVESHAAGAFWDSRFFTVCQPFPFPFPQGPPKTTLLPNLMTSCFQRSDGGRKLGVLGHLSSTTSPQSASLWG